MAVNLPLYQHLVEELAPKGVQLIAVSKTKPVEDVMALYNAGHRHFGENYVQELVQKWEELPKDICWHFIGHLQTNKVKYIAPFVHLIHGVDSFKLLKEINKQGQKAPRTISVLLQVHIAKEETKFGLDAEELKALLHHPELKSFEHVAIKGLMGMASFTADKAEVQKEFQYLKSLFETYKSITTAHCQFSILSMGMSADYHLAVKEGSTVVRIGSALFGPRT